MPSIVPVLTSVQMKIRFFVYVIFVCGTRGQSVSNEDLLQVNMINRHGDRAPMSTFPTDKHAEEEWPKGFGQLTEVGIEQMFRLGKWIRNRYRGFLSSEYNCKEIVVMSSDEDRCIMSADSNLAGLYYREEGHTWNPELKWRPVPVHSSPKHQDKIINMGKPCMKYDELFYKDLVSPASVEKEKQNKDLYDYLAIVAGTPHLSVPTLYDRVYDPLYCKRSHNLTVPVWVDQPVPGSTNQETVYDRVVSICAWGLEFLSSGEKAKFHGGPLLKEYIDNMKNAMNNDTTVKVFMYSGHDTTVAAILTILGLFDGKIPPYASMVGLELRNNKTTGYYVNLYYKNTTDTAYPLAIPGCEVNCPWDNFIRLTKKVIPTDWEQECGNYSDIQSSTFLLHIAVPCIVAEILFIILVICVKAVIEKRNMKTTYSKV